MASPTNRPGTVGRIPAPARGPDGTLGSDFRVAAPAVSIPKGGGAISNIGEKLPAKPENRRTGARLG
jgi:hypothetical protein